MEPAPIGVRGELYVGGASLARGYHADPALTAERFVPDPFAATPGTRMYRTGDVVRFRRDGTIDFLGRSDRQVKVRGSRVELGDIEAACLRVAGIAEACVVARPAGAGESRLTAYLVARPDAAPDEAAIRAGLRASLPEHMAPATITFVPELPRTPSGKIDVRALPDRVETRRPDGAPPSTDAERKVAGIWREMLELDRVGLHDNFFEVGGHSLRLVQLQQKLQDAFAREVKIVDLFRHPTVQAMAHHLAGAPAAAALDAAQQRGARQRAVLQRTRQRV
jgi:hypothetical protein